MTPWIAAHRPPCPSSEYLKYRKQILFPDLKQEIGSDIIPWNFNTQLSTVDRTSPKKTNKEILDLNYTSDQMNLTDICRTFHPIPLEYTFFSSIHRILTMVYNVLGHKTSLNKFKNEIILSIFSEHNGVKLVINKKARKFTNMWKLNNIFLNQWVQKRRQTQMETQQNIAKAI